MATDTDPNAEVANDDNVIFEPENDYPSADQVQKMDLTGAAFIREIEKVMRGPRCYVCFQWVPFFNCLGCKRHYHRKCAFLQSRGYPMPIFDLPVEVAMKADQKSVKLVKCAYCLVEETTQIPDLRSTSQGLLNMALFKMANKIVEDWDEEVLKDFPTDGPFLVTPSDIKEKAAAGKYKTVEGYFGDFQRIVFNMICKYSEKSEAADVGKMMIDKVSEELSNLIACVECYTRRWDQNGELLNAKDYAIVNVQVCEKPHPLVWVKEPSYPYWPSKLLASENGKHIVQCFNEKASVRVIPYTRDDVASGKKCIIKTFSKNHPDSKYKVGQNPLLDGAMQDSRCYLTNLMAKFGVNGVRIPEQAELYDGNLPVLAKLMFPLAELYRKQ